MRYLSAASVGLLVALTMAMTSPASAAAVKACLGKVDSVLGELGIAKEERREVSVIPRIMTTRDGGYIVGCDAWVRLERCSGAVIVDMRRNCSVRQTYTRGDCRVEGLDSY